MNVDCLFHQTQLSNRSNLLAESETNKGRVIKLKTGGPIGLIALVALSLFALCPVSASVSHSNLPVAIQQQSLYDEVALTALGFFKTQCPISSSICDLNTPPLFQPELLDKREADLQQIFGHEILRLDPKDPRPKLLYLVAEHDNHKGASNINDFQYEGLVRKFEKEIPGLQIRASRGDLEAIDGIEFYQDRLKKIGGNQGTSKIIKILNENLDVRYKVIRSPDEICKEIASAAKMGDLKSLIIAGHHAFNNDISSSYSEIQISSSSKLVSIYPEALSKGNVPKAKLYSFDVSKRERTEIDESCFSGLSSNATISLISCYAGEKTNGIANVISKLSNRVVWASKEDISIVATKISRKVPPVPTFFNHDEYVQGTLIDTTCQFYPNHIRKCRQQKRN